MKMYKLLAELLDYPDAALVADLRRLVADYEGAGGLVLALDPARRFAGAEREQIVRFIEWLLAQDATELEANYVKTFDLVPEHSLHLTHHLFGDDKNRGPALIDLAEYYKSFGFQHDEREIPDYLPLMLEFVSRLEPAEAGIFLADAAKIFKVLAANLEQAESPYAPLIRVIEQHATLTKLAA